MKTIKLNDNVNKLLTELSKKRKANGELNSTKQSIVHELVINLHKKEIK